jgi:RNA-binding protein
LGLRRLGTVLHTTPNGYIVVKIDDPDNIPPLNVRVYDRDLRSVGVLLDIIGPVKEPYAVIKPATKETKLPSGEVVYYKPPRPRRPKPVRKAQKMQRRRGSQRRREERRGGGRGRERSGRGRGRR